jgi:hypothetical protein
LPAFRSKICAVKSVPERHDRPRCSVASGWAPRVADGRPLDWSARSKCIDAKQFEVPRMQSVDAESLKVSPVPHERAQEPEIAAERPAE